MFIFLMTFTGCIQEKDIDKLINDLSSYNETTGNNAENKLIKIGKPAVEPLIEVLKNKNNPARGYAAKILGQIGDRRAIEPLVDCLTELDSQYPIIGTCICT